MLGGVGEFVHDFERDNMRLHGRRQTKPFQHPAWHRLAALKEQAGAANVRPRDAFQIERAGQWVKGKSFPTFNPLGPEIVTPDAIDPNNLRLWCSINGVMKQDSNTDDLLFGLHHIVWYISQFMELFPGDIINSGTPFGVGLGFKPPVYLAIGDIVKTGIEGIGEITNNCVAYK